MTTANVNVSITDSVVPELQISDYTNTANNYITPPLIATVYNIPSSDGAGVTVGIISLGGGFQQNDLDRTMSDLGLPSPHVTFVSAGAANTFGGDSGSLENTLDIMCVASMVPAANIRVYIAPNSVGGPGTGMYTALSQAINDNCDVITISWGVDEIIGVGDCLGPLLSLASSRGITVLAASGDYGSASSMPSPPPPLPMQPSVSYPASSPYVIAVGGTALTIDYNGNRLTEYAAQKSGGGFSTVFPSPEWQYQTGITYSESTPSGIQGPYVLNSFGFRGVPDIAAPFYHYIMYFGGKLVGVNGTSAATPVMAGMVARFIALKNGARPPLGAVTLNTMFYASPGYFTETQLGSIDVGSTGNWIPANATYGYLPKSLGWDSITGMGAPVGNSIFNNLPYASRPVVTPANISNIKIKTSNTTWSNVGNIYVKTSTNTWAAVAHSYTKTATGWQQTF